MNSSIPLAAIERRIYLIRGRRVILDRDLAAMYGVKTFNALRFQIGILDRGRHSKYLPLAFTEQGVSMLSSVLRSARAVHVNIAIMRAFVRLRQLTATHRRLAHKLEELEGKFKRHDAQIEDIFGAIRELMEPPIESKPRIGFKIGSD